MSSGRGLSDGLITRPEESYRLWCDCVLAKSRQRGDPDPQGAVGPWKKKEFISVKHLTD